MLRLRMCGAILPVPHTLSCYGTRSPSSKEEHVGYLFTFQQSVFVFP
jgi:hypothetical protein